MSKPKKSSLLLKRHFAQKSNDMHGGVTHLKSYRLKIEQWGNNRPIGGNITFVKFSFLNQVKFSYFFVRGILFSTPWGLGGSLLTKIFILGGIFLFLFVFSGIYYNKALLQIDVFSSLIIPWCRKNL